MIKKTEEEIALQIHADALWAEYLAIREQIDALEAKSNEIYKAHTIAEEKLEVYHEERWAARNKRNAERDTFVIESALVN